MALNTKPTADVTVAVESEVSGVTASPSPLVFTPDNWFTARTVTVRAAADASGTQGNITNTADSSDTNYDTVSKPVVVEVLDNDIPGVAVNPTSLSITEGGSDSYTLVLTKAPTATVTVEISGATGDVSVSRSAC